MSRKPNRPLARVLRLILARGVTYRDIPPADRADAIAPRAGNLFDRPVSRRRRRRAIWRATYPVLCSASVLSLTAYMQPGHANPLLSVTLAPAFSGGIYGLVAGGSLTAKPGGTTASGALIGGGAISLAVSAGGLVTITDTGEALPANLTIVSTSPASGDTLGILGDDGSGLFVGGSTGTLLGSQVDQIFFGNQTIAGSLTFAETGFTTRGFTFPAGSLNLNYPNIVALGPTKLSYLEANTLNQAASISATGFGNLPIFVNGTLTETDAFGDTAALGWANSEVLGNGRFAGAIDPVPLGSDTGGLWQCAVFAALSVGAWGIAQRRNGRAGRPHQPKF